jgi:hypothetical protein
MISPGDVLQKRILRFFVARGVRLIDERAHQIVPLLFTECPCVPPKSRYCPRHLSRPPDVSPYLKEPHVIAAADLRPTLNL